MKIIQSFWSKPAFHAGQSYSNSRKFGGFLSFKYFLISSAYSCLTLKKHHGKVWMYTDKQGQELMGDLLQLPFEEISTILDAIDNEDHRLWILGKMNVIAQQREPFIHVDNDIYVWEKLPSPQGVIVQSQCPIWTEYKLSLNEIFANFGYIPECLRERPTERTMVANVGLIGGHDIEFFQRFCELSSNLLELNRQYLHLVNVGGFNQMMEEYLFTCMIRQENKDVFYLMESLAKGIPPSHLNFALAPSVYRYIHLIGNYKQSAFACEQLELRLRYEFPEAYVRVNEVLNDLGVVGSELKLNENRHARLLRSMHVFYSHDMDSIRRMKIRLRPGAEIIKLADYLTNNVQYAVQESDHPMLFHLPTEATNGVSQWLEDPNRRLHRTFTINELAEDLKQSGSEFSMISSIAFNLMHTGLMEFA
jgi:hypothetical protein